MREAAALPERLEELHALVLGEGKHAKPELGMCVMEAVSWVAGEPFSDHPACASPVIAAFLRHWNDDTDKAGRQKLKPYIPKLVGTRASAAVEAKRGWLVADFILRVHTPTWLEASGLKEQADALRALGPLRDKKSAELAQPAMADANAKSWDLSRAARAALAARAARAALAALDARAALDALAAAEGRKLTYDEIYKAVYDEGWKVYELVVVSLHEPALRLLDDLIACNEDTQ